jgi:hypothetical protein
VAESRCSAHATNSARTTSWPLPAARPDLDAYREPLGGLLRPGNAGANTASDHVEVVDLALAQLPRDVVESAQIVVRTDSAGASHQLTDELHGARINFLMTASRTIRARPSPILA